jgi:cellulose biosynthesis protein BcsQ
MVTYAFWNNKGGTGKTSLAFQTVSAYANQYPNKKILVVDVCPQANMSELLLGGLEGKGSDNLLKIQGQTQRATIGGYFQDKLINPYQKQQIVLSNFVSTPNGYNSNVPANIDLICGDPLLELQSNAISTLANTQLPTVNTWISVIEWIEDLVNAGKHIYHAVFFDTNPSFSIYTQMALAATTRLILPVMADDSSRRALQNAFSLIYGFKLPHPFYQEYAFATKLKVAEKPLPRVHLVLKNRLTQYMGAASAYKAVLNTIKGEVDRLLSDEETKWIFSSSDADEILVDVRDFQTTGVVSHARGCPFFKQTSGTFDIQGRRVGVKPEYLENCIAAISDVVAKLD